MPDQALQQISIVMLTHNDMGVIARTLERFLPLVEGELFCEMLILDNGSSDGTSEYLQSVKSSSKVRVIIAGTRDHLIHGYDLIDHRVLWDAVQIDIPRLIEAIDELLA